MTTVIQEPVRGQSEPRAQAAPALNVMVVADHLGYPGGVVHGVTSYFLTVLPALARAGVKLTVCYLRDPHPAADELRARGIEPTFLSAARANPIVALQVARMARREGCTIFHAMGIKAILMARLAARLVPARTVLHLHDLVEPGAVVGRMQRFFARPTDLAVCVSNAIVPIAVRRYNVLPNRVRVVHNGIDLERFEQAPAGARLQIRNSLGLEEGRPVMLMVGRMHPIKGHRAMLGMMPAILRRCPDAVLLLAGDGPERSVCEEIVRSHRLEHQVRLLGQRSDVPELLQASDLVVVPSKSEGFGLAVVEAFAAGRPVVAFDCGGISDILDHGSTGFLLPAGGDDAFVDAASSLLLDAPKRAELGANARKAAARFSIRQHIGQLLAVYSEAIESVDVRPASTTWAEGGTHNGAP